MQDLIMNIKNILFISLFTLMFSSGVFAANDSQLDDITMDVVENNDNGISDITQKITLPPSKSGVYSKLTPKQKEKIKNARALRKMKAKLRRQKLKQALKSKRNPVGSRK